MKDQNDGKRAISDAWLCFWSVSFRTDEWQVLSIPPFCQSFLSWLIPSYGLPGFPMPQPIVEVVCQGQNTIWSRFLSHSSNHEDGMALSWSLVYECTKEDGSYVFMKIMSMSNPGYKSGSSLGWFGEPLADYCLTGYHAPRRVVPAIKDAGCWYHGFGTQPYLGFQA